MAEREGARAKGRVVNDIKALRTALGLTQQALADAAGATRQTIIAVEAGKYSPSLELAFRLSRVLGAPFEHVFDYREAE
ncbi:MAG: helix-turn-helix transcriptional regulator [Parvularculaceae bacterium]